MPPIATATSSIGAPVAGGGTVQVVGSPEQRARNQSALDHLDERLAAAATMTPDEVADADREWHEFRRAVNDNRMSERLRYVD